MLLLHIDSSVLGGHSASRSLTAQIVAAEVVRHPGIQVVHRDLAASPFDHLTGEHVAALRNGVAPTTPRVVDDLVAGAGALAEFLAADVIVIGAPMYNFAIPTQLKSWIDRIAVAGKTFKYGPGGVVGLAGGKRVIIASTRGAVYGAESGLAFLDHQESYLKGVLGFLGITDIQIVRAEGLGMTDKRDASIAAARASIAVLA